MKGGDESTKRGYREEQGRWRIHLAEDKEKLKGMAI